MTKQAHRQAKRLSPIGLEGIEACRAIVARHAAAKVNEVMVDAFSASGITEVYDALKPENQVKFVTLSVRKATDVAFRLIDTFRLINKQGG